VPCTTCCRTDSCCEYRVASIWRERFTFFDSGIVHKSYDASRRLELERKANCLLRSYLRIRDIRRSASTRLPV
jgi:hypothetical protein